MFFLAILLFSYCQMSQHIQKTTANGKEMLSNPKLVLVQGTSNVVMKQNVTLSCLSEPGSPPVRYTLFKHNQQVSALNRSDLTPALFTLTISSASDMGEYKCKAEYNNSSGGKYSNSLKITLIEPISKPVLSSPTSQAKKGQNVTLSCFSENGSLPITYLFFKGTQNISPQKTMRKREAAVIFLFIDSLSDFGTYKCKANNSFPNNTKYSNGFNFTLAEERSHSQPLIISLGLILLLLIIGFALAIPFFVIPLYKAKKFKSTRPPIGLTSTVNAEESENEVIYSEIEPVKPEEYINFCVIRREEEKGNLEDPDLTENTCTTKFLQ
ncbi:PREDICTED: allergin-1 isoform X1 [Pseudopodoces humilis]|uniref:allergin-1 isoform X1 n=1 Tax=Pseudopodoces humilis TaxID=181119 RepID=UPI0006B75349|nr:PREDICTED: allergin-1 isoform X1 [Pseudopodoces humilis]